MKSLVHDQERDGVEAGGKASKLAEDALVAEAGSAAPGAKTEAIYRQIYGAILDHSLPPGTRLREEALCEAFQVSRTRIRKVLQRLGHEQIVELHPNRGAAVAQPSVQEAREIFAARRVVEAGLIKAVAARAAPEMVARLRTFVAEERAAQGRGDQPAAIRLSGEFHLELAAMAENGPLLGFLRELVSRTSLIIALYESPGAPPCSCPDHEALVELVAAGDGEGAVEMMARHLHGIEANLRLETPEQRAVDFKNLFAPV